MPLPRITILAALLCCLALIACGGDAPADGPTAAAEATVPIDPPPPSAAAPFVEPVALVPSPPPVPPPVPAPEALAAVVPESRPPASVVATPPPAPELPAAPAANPAAPAAAPAPPDDGLLARLAAADLAAGATFFARCAACHSVGAGDAPLAGPGLFGIVGAPVAGQAGFGYSAAFRALNVEGATWTFERLDAFLRDPALAVSGTRMGLGGIPGDQDRANVILYLRTLATLPVPLVAAAAGDDGPRVVSFTAAQAAAGGDLYRVLNCVRCHGLALRGVVDVRDEGEGLGDGPPIVGRGFALRWFQGTAGDLYAFLRDRKPADARGTLSPEAYAELLAFILAENGYLPGETALPGDPAQLGELGFPR